MSSFTVSYASNMSHEGNFRHDLQYETQCAAVEKARKSAHKKWCQVQQHAAAKTLTSEVVSLKMLVVESHCFQLKHNSCVLEQALRSRCTQASVAEAFEEEQNQSILAKGGLSPLSLKELVSDVDVLYQALLQNSPPGSPVTTPRSGSKNENHTKRIQDGEPRYQKTSAYNGCVDVLKSLPMWVCKQQSI